MSTDEKKKKGAEEQGPGFELGQISFGVGQPATPPEETPTKPSTPDEAGGSPRPAPADGPQEAMPLLPLRAIFVADLMPRGEFNAGANAPEQAVRIDPMHFDQLFAKLQPRLALEVPSVLVDGGPVRLDLSPTSIDSFRPDRLCQEVPLLRSLLDGRRVLEQLREGSVGLEQAGAELSRLWAGSPLARKVLGLVDTPAAGGAGPAGPPAPAAEPAPSVDRILDMVDMGTTADAAEVASPAPPPPAPAPTGSSSKSKFGGFIAAVAKSARSGSGARPDQAIAQVERAVCLQLGAILQHEEVRRLERSWRGVHFVAKRVGSHHGTRLEIVSAPPEEAATALDRAIRANAGIEPPVSFAVVEDSVDGSAPSLARLRELAEVAEAHTLPVITNGTPELFGYTDLAKIDRLDNKATLYDAPERAPWRSASQQLSMRWVSIAMNRVLARLPYDRRTSRIREAQVEELPNDETAVVWMDPCWAVASVSLVSFQKTGWPCRITGARNGGTLENLPVREVRLAYEGAETIAIPTEVMISVETQRALGRYGVLALAAAPNNDEVYLVHAATAYVTPPKRTYDSDTTEPEIRLPQVPLGDQLFVARLVQFLQALGAKIPPGSPPSEVKPVMEAALWELFDNAPPAGPEIELDIRGGDGAESVAVTIRPRRFLGVSIEEFSLEVPLG